MAYKSGEAHGLNEMEKLSAHLHSYQIQAVAERKPYQAPCWCGLQGSSMI